MVDRRQLRKHLPLGAILFFGAFLRLYRLGATSLWRDEIETMVFSLAPLKKIVDYALKIPFIPRPPLYYFLNHYLLKLQASDTMLRLPAAICSIAALALTWYLARRWFGRRTALLAAFLMAISPYQVHYAQEGREYAFLMLLALIDLICLDLAIERSLLWLAPWTATAVAILYTHHFGAFVLGAQWLIVPVLCLAGHRPGGANRRRFLTVFSLLSLLVVVCWLPLLRHLLAGVAGPRGMRGLTLKPNFSLDDFRVMLGLVTFGNGPLTPLVLPLAVLGFLPLGTWRKRGPVMAFLWILPVVFLSLFGHFAHAFRIRYYIFVLPVWFMVIARGASVIGIFLPRKARTVSFARFRRPWLRLWAILLVAAAVLWVTPYLLAYYREQRANWQAAAAFLKKASGDDGRIVVTGEGERGVNFHYFILNHYAGLGPRIKVLHLDLALDKDLLKLLKHGRPLWYAGTRPEVKLPFRNKPELLRRAGYTALAPIIFGANTRLTVKERKFLAPYRYKEVCVVPYWPGSLSPAEVRNLSRKLLDEARTVPGNFLNTAPTENFLRGKRVW